MSKYTTEVRYICENASGLKYSLGWENADTIIASAYDKIFDSSWELYDEDYRGVLCPKILKHYYTREICAETVGLWKLWLNERMGMIMPYYNQLYESTLLEFKPFYDIDYYDEMESTGTQAETTNEKSVLTLNTKQTTNIDESADDWQMYSDTPQGGLSGISSNKYLTNATNNTHEGESETVGTTTGTNDTDTDTSRDLNSTDNYLKHVYGKFNSSKSYAQLLKELRESFLNIDAMIIEELSDLFLTLW